MTITIEDGTGLAGANSYVSEDDLDNYADDRGYTLAAGDAEAALIRATQALDALYFSRFSGTRVNGRTQGLEWPRRSAVDVTGTTIEVDEIPIEVQRATMEFAVRELAVPNSILVDLERGGAIKSVKAGSVEIVYGANATNVTVFQLVNGIMGPLVGGGVRPSLFGTSARA